MAERDHLNAKALAATADSSLASRHTQERSSDEIRQQIAATRDSITETVDELSSRVQRTFDWKTYIAEYPLAVTGAAAGLGLLLGYMAKPSVTPQARIHDALADLIEDASARFQAEFNGLGLRRPGASQALRATVIAALVQAGTNLVRDKFIEKQQGQPQERETRYYTDEMDGVDAAYQPASRRPLSY